MERVWLERIVFVIALVVLVLGTAGGPGWVSASNAAVLAIQLERDAAAPLYGLLGAVATYLPVGEPGFRLAVLNAVIGATLLVGVLRAGRALLPKDPVAAVIPVVLLALAPPFRDAAAFAGPSVLAATGLVWAIALSLEHAREPTARRALGALACVAATIGSAPWLGALTGVLLAGWLWRTGRRVPTSGTPNVLAIAVFAIGMLIVVLWFGALGRLPGMGSDLTAAITTSGRGSSAILVGAGLLGTAFAAITGLASARALAAVIALVALHTIVFDPAPLPLLAVFAIACAVLPSAVVRAVPSERRHLVALAAGLPLVGAALLVGPAFSVDDPRDAPARLATDLIGSVPPGPGVFIATRLPTWSAVEYAQIVAGARPDLQLAPPLPVETADTLAVRSLRIGQVAAADVPAFGRLEPRRAYPRGRGFELHLDIPPITAPLPLPARYDSELGAEQSVLLAVDRARYEAVSGRLGLAARAAGLTARFGAADLAILSTTAPAQPAMFDLIPNLDGLPPGPWLLELLGDDLAWVAGLDVAAVETPRERKLHSLWRALLRGEIQRDDPAFAALGPAAMQATDEMLARLKRP